MNIAAYTKFDISPIINNLPEDLQSRIVIRHYKSSEEIEPDLPGVDILLTTGRVKEEIIQQAPNLKWVQALSAGVDFLPLEEIARRGILLSNARGIHKIQMSEFALLLMLQWARRLPLIYRNQQNKRWDQNIPNGELYGHTLGIIGPGSIGEAIALKAKIFGMRTVGLNQSGRAAPGFDEIYSGSSGLDRILAESDYLIMLMPSTPKTKKFLSLEQFRKMKPSAYFINLARGSVVDENGLIEALQNGILAGAALDVFEEEPLPENSTLWSLDNVTITPHVAGATPHYIERASEIVFENIRRFLAGEPLLNAVDPVAGY